MILALIIYNVGVYTKTRKFDTALSPLENTGNPEFDNLKLQRRDIKSLKKVVRLAYYV